MFARSLQGFLSRPSHYFAGPESSPVPVHSSHSQSLPRSSTPTPSTGTPLSSCSTIGPAFSAEITSSTAGDPPFSPVNHVDATLTKKRGWLPPFLDRYPDAFLLRRVAHTQTPRNSSPVMRLLHTSLYTGESRLLPQKPARNSRPASVAWPLLPTRQSVDPNPACALFLQLSTFGFRPLQVQSPHLTQGDR
jgi:hypothetical protein